MNFLVDAQLPPALCGWLQARGYPATHVFEIGMVAASDAEIAARAEAHGEIIVSKDEDFLVLRLPNRFAFLWLRLGNTTNQALFAWLEAGWRQVESALSEGERVVEVR